MAEIWKYIPNQIGIFRRGLFHPSAPVTTVILHPPVPANVHPGTAIRGDWTLAEIITPEGTRTYGFADGYITPRLRTAVKLGPGQERDEVVAKWKKAPPPPRSKVVAHSAIATRAYEYVVYPEASHRFAERSVKVPVRAVRGSARPYDLTDAKRVAKEMGSPAAIYSVSKGRFVGYVHSNGRYVTFR